MNIVLGLGNPGAGYAGTRHNIGFMVAERLAQICGVRFPAAPAPEFLAWVVRVPGDGPVLARPATFMNRSGDAAARLLAAWQTEPDGLIAVYDDADLPFGRIRIRPGGGSGGHNGIRSLMEELGTGEFTRVRMGVLGPGRGDGDLADYVLAEFDREERGQLDRFVLRGAEAVQAIFQEGVEPAMNRFNRPPAGPPEEEEIHPGR